MSVNHIGKRLVSTRNETMYARFPDNKEESKTLPSGKPSPIITGYLANGNYELEKDKDSRFYLMNNESIKVVSPNAKDESSTVKSLGLKISDFFSNAKTKTSKSAGFLKDGFEEAVDDLKEDSLFLTKEIKIVVTLIIAILTLVLGIQIFNKFK